MRVARAFDTAGLGRDRRRERRFRRQVMAGPDDHRAAFPCRLTRFPSLIWVDLIGVRLIRIGCAILSLMAPAAPAAPSAPAPAVAILAVAAAVVTASFALLALLEIAFGRNARGVARLRIDQRRRAPFSAHRSGRATFGDRKSTRLNSSHSQQSRMPSSA